MKTAPSSCLSREKPSLNNVTERRKRGSSADNPHGTDSGYPQMSSPGFNWDVEINGCASETSSKTQRETQCSPRFPSEAAGDPQTQPVATVRNTHGFQLQESAYENADMDLTASEVNKIIAISKSNKNQGKKKTDRGKAAFRKVKDPSSDKRRERAKRKCKGSSEMGAEGKMENGPEGGSVVLGGRGDSEDPNCIADTEPPQANMLKEITLPSSLDQETMQNKKRKQRRRTGEQEETERIAKCHGTQCGFCTPGMVMSMYALLRNHPEPTLDQLTDALGGNLCRCTGYRPIIDACKTFCKASGCCQSKENGVCCNGDLGVNGLAEVQEADETSPELFSEEEFLPLDPTQELIFPPELMTMAEKQPPKTRMFSGERMTWISPVTLKELVEVKSKYPQAPIVMGNTSVGPEVKFKGVFHPVVISPDRIEEMCVVSQAGDDFISGLTLGAGLSLEQVKDILADVVRKLPEEKTQTYRALLKHLRTLAGSQIRNMAWEFVSAFRQAQRQQNALAIVNSGMRVLFREGGDNIKELSIVYGGVGPTTVSAKNSCQKLIGRPWDEEMFHTACRLVLNEVTLPGSAPGGKVEFKRTLIISFLFKFYLEVCQSLKRMVSEAIVWTVMPKAGQQTLLSIPRCRSSITQSVDPKQIPQDPIGRPIMHLSGIKHATGEAIFCDDMPAVDRELFLTFVTSSRAHAKIVSMDLSEALSLPGVVDIITADHLQDANTFDTVTFLATDEVHCVGHLVCAVIAESETHARRAAKRVKVVYQDLEPPILTIEEAIRHKSFFGPERKLECGDVDEAFKMADQILEGEIHIGGQEHFYMETQSMLVVPKGEDGEIDVYVSTQFPKYIQDVVASTLKLSVNKVMCHVRRVGGAFGGKVDKTSVLAAVTAFAASKHGRAVRCILERGEDMLITGGRHPYLGKYKVGFMKDGRIVALDMEHYCNGGSSLDESLWVIEMGLLKTENAYKFPNLRCRGRVCKTNLPSNTAFRGFGFPQAGLVTEVCITEVAIKCGLSPEQVRTINMYKPIDCTHYKQEINAKPLLECWRECMAKSSFAMRKTAVEKFNAENSWKKRGLAMIPLKFPVGLFTVAMGQAAALVHVYLDGSVLVTHGGIEMGQGVHTKMIQVVSRELRMPMSSVHLRGTSTETVPNTNASGGSVVADLNGLAVKAQTAFDQSISLSAIGYFRGYEAEMNWETGEGHIFEYFVFGAACSEVEIDCLTGNHKAIRTDIVMDVGHSINPALDIGQVEGAFVQGMGLYTIEELSYSPQGVLYSRGPNQYKIPAICDIPTEMHVSFLPPSEHSNTLYSSKGLGESGVFLGCSVFFAIHDAVRAARQERGISAPLRFKSPLTPEKIRMACEDTFTKMDCSVIPRATVTTLLGVPAPKRKEIKAKYLVGAGRTDVCGADKGTGLPAPPSGLLRYPPATLVQPGSPLPENQTPPPVLPDEILHLIPDSVPDPSRAGRTLEPAGSARRAGPGAQIPFLGEGTDLQAGGGGRSGLTGADSPPLKPGRPPHAPGARPPSRPVLRFKLRGGWRPMPQPIGVRGGGAKASWSPEVEAGRGGTRCCGEQSGRG
ncbi:Aldehyde oxidase 1 [Microtus ochrogaster]|uniref:xanthine dehydrogenase n=1 Tax=Microtus ochrogaster TaxID=79684 RepID=A0A8J6GIT9_MICOH|nr:Aldehyde oxidase 1 [Microtus ochrogaster]